MKQYRESEMLRSTGEMSEKYVLTTIVQQILPFLASLALAGCDALEASPYQVIKSDLVVTEVNTQINLPRFQWLNNHQLVVVAFDHEILRPNNLAYLTESLVLWDITTNTATKIVEPDVGGLCLRNDQIKYFKRKTDPEGIIPRDSQQREHFIGPIGKGKLIDFQEPTDAMTCDSKKTQGGLPEWTKNVPDPEINIRRLRPEHGFLWIERDTNDQPVRRLQFYRANARQDQGVDLSSLLGTAPLKYPSLTPHYFAHKQAYLLNSMVKGLPPVWLSPEGTLEPALSRDQVVINLKRKNYTYSAYTLAGVVFGASSFVEDNVGDGGLFYFDSRLTLQRVVPGRIAQELEVSPDGCKVAFANDDRPTIDPRKPMLFHKLQVINLCTEKVR